MSQAITAEAVRPDVQSDEFTTIPFGPSVRRLKPGTVKVLAAVVRASWVDRDTRRRITLASNRALAELAAVAPKTIGRHLRELAEAGVLTEDQHEGRRRLTLPEIQPREFVRLDNTDPAWTLNQVPFVVLLAVRSYDYSNRGYAFPTDATLARSLGWSVRAVKRGMAELRRAEAVATSSRYDNGRRSRKRVITIGTKVVLLCDTGHRDKSGPYHGTKVVPTMGQKWSLPPDKSGPLNQSFEREKERKLKTTNQESVSGQSESEPGAELAKVVVVGVQTSTDTNPEPKPQPAGPPTPAPLAEVVSLLAESGLNRAEQERYLAIAKRLAETDTPPPIAWHRHALNVQPSSGTISLPGVIIARLKAWETTPPDKRQAIVDEIEGKNADVIAKNLRSAKFRYEGFLRDLKAGSKISPAKVREKWERYNTALAAAGQPAVQLDSAVIRAEHEANTQEGHQDELAKQGAILAEATPPVPTEPIAPPPAPAPSAVDPAEQERMEREKAEDKRIEAETRERHRIEYQRHQIEKKVRAEVNSRIAAWARKRTTELLEKGRSGIMDLLRAERAIELARIEAAVRAEFAPNLAALASTPSSPPPAIPAMVSR